MRRRELWRRELRIVFGARVTWFALATAALLVGHSFILAIDLFSAASRSALGFGLMQREMDPLVGVLRPMLGGLYLATALLVPVIATRGLAIERERRSYGALALAAGGTTRIVVAKGAAAVCASLLLVVPVVGLCSIFVVLGGHLDGTETSVALLGHVLHLIAMSAAALAAAAATRTQAQATTLAVAVSLASWAIDAGEGFAALAWVGELDWASVATQLEPFERGIIRSGSVAWLATLAAVGFTAAANAARLERPVRRWPPVLGALLVGAAGAMLASGVHHARDMSEARRASLPPAAVDALRKLEAPLRIELMLDRDDGRRAQVERDALARLRLARPDLIVDTPLDRRDKPVEGERVDDYGRIIVQVGEVRRETRSTSRRELTTLIFEAAGASLPDWSQPQYPGYPLIIEGGRRTFVAVMAYVLQPLGLLVVGWLVTRIRRRSS